MYHIYTNIKVLAIFSAVSLYCEITQTSYCAKGFVILLQPIMGTFCLHLFLT